MVQLFVTELFNGPITGGERPVHDPLPLTDSTHLYLEQEYWKDVKKRDDENHAFAEEWMMDYILDYKYTIKLSDEEGNIVEIGGFKEWPKWLVLQSC